MFGELATETGQASNNKPDRILDYRRFAGICCHAIISIDVITHGSLYLLPSSVENTSIVVV
jgi:hypothetical protein